MTIDSHCHLNQEDYNIPVSELIHLAQEEGVQSMMGVACDPKDWDELIQILKAHSSLYGAIGIHPEYANQENDEPLKMITHLFKENPALVAFGEIGLDYHEAPKTKEKQKELFFKQIKLANSLQKPIMIHTRDAEADTFEILTKSKEQGLINHSGVIHCFTGSLDFAKKALEMGFYISASGVITFKSAQNLREIFKTIPLDKLLVETDSPWLAPEPFRGRKNQPAYVQKTLEKLAELKNISVAEMEKITDENFKRLYLRGKA